jgi:hypothetical protein
MKPETIKCPEKGTPGAFLGQDEGLAFRVAAAPVLGFRYTTYSLLYCREMLPTLSADDAPSSFALFKSIDAYHKKSLATLANMEAGFTEQQDSANMVALNQVIRGSIFNKFFLYSMLSRIIREKNSSQGPPIPSDDWMSAGLAASVMEHYGERLYMAKAGRVGVSLHSIRVFANDAVESVLRHTEEWANGGAYETLSLLPQMDPRVEIIKMAVPKTTVWEDVELPEDGWYNTTFNPGIEF